MPLLATYRVVHGLCGHASDTPADVASYKGFVDGFAQGIGSYHAVLFLEMDSIITMGCLSRHGQAVREQELQYAINTLTADCPHLVIYLDAGAADALSARQAARYLRRSGVAQIQGFFLNATHFDWTSNEIRYGEQISRLTGGKHFVVNTGDNGRGPLRPPDRVHSGNEILCNPAGRGLGPRPTADTGFPNVDMFAWTTNPGRIWRPLRSRRTEDRRVLARLRADARAQRELQLAVAARLVRAWRWSRSVGRTIVPHPTTRSPSIRHASWPGAAPSTASANSISSAECRPDGGSPARRHSSGGDR